MAGKIRVTVWGENVHDKTDKKVQKIYPKGMHETIADFLRKSKSLEVRTATLDMPSHGLTDEVLKNTDVMTWWGHAAHDKVSDEIVKKVQQRVLAGMGLIVLHSGHFSKIFRVLMGANCSLKWREAAEKERLWNVAPGHPITQGLGDYFELPHTEMYGERFDIPEPDQLIFISWFEGGDVFRSGCVFNRGNGKVFYFRPGHETFPIFHDANIQKVMTNAVHWAAAPGNYPTDPCPNVKVPLETIRSKEE